MTVVARTPGPSKEESVAVELAGAYVGGDPRITCEIWGADISDPRGVLFRRSEMEATFCFRTSPDSDVVVTKISWPRLHQLGAPTGIRVREVVFEAELRRNDVHQRLLSLCSRKCVFVALRHGSIELAAKWALQTLGLSTVAAERKDQDFAWGIIFHHCHDALADYDRRLMRPATDRNQSIQDFIAPERVADLRALLAVECVDARYQKAEAEVEFFVKRTRRGHRRRKRCRFCGGTPHLRAPYVFNDWTPICRFCLLAGSYIPGDQTVAAVPAVYPSSLDVNDG